MRQLFKLIAEKIGAFFALIWPAGIASFLGLFAAHIYTGYLRCRFGHFGDNSVIKPRVLYLRGLKRVAIGKRVTIGKDATISVWTATGSITIGDSCSFGARNHITSCNSIAIGSGLLTGSDVLITDNAHGRADRASLALPPIEREVVSKGPVRIGDNVWLGNNVCVMPGVTIGDGAVVGANSIVTHDLPPYTVCAGIPARPLRKAEP